MDNIHRLVFSFLLLFSCLVFANEDYPIVSNTTYSGYPNPNDFCIANYGALHPASIFRTNDYGCYLPPDGPVVQGSNPGYTSYTCPGGGYPDIANHICLNAVSCVYPAVRLSSGLCGEPEVQCKYPEVRDRDVNMCREPECPISQRYNYLMMQCDDLPYCADAEKTVETTSGFVCELKPLACPGHTHASSSNDRCLPDPALVCPIGMHDNGSYECVANDREPCSSNQVAGYIDGQHNCINKTNAAQAAARAAADKAYRDTEGFKARAAAIAAQEAQDAYASAQAASDADPTNNALHDAAQSAYNNAISAINASNSASASSVAADAAYADSSASNNSAQLQSIAEQMHDLSKHSKSAAASSSSSAVSNRETADSTKYLADQQADLVSPGFDAGTFPGESVFTPVDQDINSGSVAPLGSSSVCPAPYQISMSFASQTLSFQPLCDLVSSIKPLFLLLCSLSAAYIVFGTVKS